MSMSSNVKMSSNNVDEVETFKHRWKENWCKETVNDKVLGDSLTRVRGKLGTAYCNKCDCELIYKSGGLTSLTRHLRSTKHLKNEALTANASMTPACVNGATKSELQVKNAIVKADQAIQRSCPTNVGVQTEHQCTSKTPQNGATKSKLEVNNASVAADRDIEKSGPTNVGVQTEQQCRFAKMVRDFQNLLYNELDTDVTMKVKEREFKAHRCVLSARTPVFSEMFKQNMSERNSGIIPIDECEPNTFQEFLHYVYTGSVKMLCHENVFDLYKLSDKYQVEELKEECVEYLKKILSVDTFCDVIILSLKHDEKELLRMATELFCTQMKDIIISIKWRDFICEYPLYANELLIKRVQYEANQNV